MILSVSYCHMMYSMLWYILSHCEPVFSLFLCYDYVICIA